VLYFPLFCSHSFFFFLLSPSVITHFLVCVDFSLFPCRFSFLFFALSVLLQKDKKKKPKQLYILFTLISIFPSVPHGSPLSHLRLVCFVYYVSYCFTYVRGAFDVFSVTNILSMWTQMLLCPGNANCLTAIPRLDSNQF
jgi:hypothetical protein